MAPSTHRTQVLFVCCHVNQLASAHHHLIHDTHTNTTMPPKPKSKASTKSTTDSRKQQGSNVDQQPAKRSCHGTKTNNNLPQPISRTKQPRQQRWAAREEREQQEARGRKPPLSGALYTRSMAIVPSIVCSILPISNPLTQLHRKTGQDRNHEDAALQSPPR